MRLAARRSAETRIAAISRDQNRSPADDRSYARFVGGEVNLCPHIRKNFADVSTGDVRLDHQQLLLWNNVQDLLAFGNDAAHRKSREADHVPGVGRADFHAAEPRLWHSSGAEGRRAVWPCVSRSPRETCPAPRLSLCNLHSRYGAGSRFDRCETRQLSNHFVAPVMGRRRLQMSAAGDVARSLSETTRRE